MVEKTYDEIIEAIGKLQSKALEGAESVAHESQIITPQNYVPEPSPKSFWDD